jgi:hypothetical protein
MFFACDIFLNKCISGIWAPLSRYYIDQWRNQGMAGVANGQLPISFTDLPIVIFTSKLLPIEILLFQNCLFIFELDSNYIVFSSV